MIVLKDFKTNNSLVISLKKGFSMLNNNVIIDEFDKFYFSPDFTKELFSRYVSLVKQLNKKNPTRVVRIVPMRGKFSLAEILADISVLLMLGIPKEVVKQVVGVYLSSITSDEGFKTLVNSVDLIDGHLRFTLLNFAVHSYYRISFRFPKIEKTSIWSMLNSYFIPNKKKLIRRNEGILDLLRLFKALYSVSIGGEDYIKQYMTPKGYSKVPRPIKVNDKYTMGRLLFCEDMEGDISYCKLWDTYYFMPVFNFKGKLLIVHTPENSVVSGDVKKILVQKDDERLIKSLVNEINNKYDNAIGLLDNGRPYLGVIDGDKLYMLKIKCFEDTYTIVLDYPSMRNVPIGVRDYLLNTISYSMFCKK